MRSKICRALTTHRRLDSTTRPVLQTRESCRAAAQLPHLHTATARASLPTAGGRRPRACTWRDARGTRRNQLHRHWAHEQALAPQHALETATSRGRTQRSSRAGQSGALCTAAGCAAAADGAHDPLLTTWRGRRRRLSKKYPVGAPAGAVDGSAEAVGDLHQSGRARCPKPAVVLSIWAVEALHARASLAPAADRRRGNARTVGRSPRP